MSKNLYNVVIAALIIIILGLGIYSYFKEPTPNPNTIYVTNTRIDTVYKYNTDTLTIKIPTLKTIYTHEIDTIVITQAFEKSFDTATTNAKLEVCYYFPADTFKVKLQTKITEILRTDTLKQTIEIPVETNKYDKWLYGGVGVVGGIILGVVIAK